MGTNDMAQYRMRWGIRVLRRELHLLLGSLLLLLGAACSTPTPSASPSASLQGGEQTTETASYRIKIRAGPMVTMMTMTAMSTTDQGQPVNRHLEVHIFDRNSGAQLKDLIPKVTITNQATGVSRGLPNVTACLESNHLEVEPHFGDNLYLPDGNYAVTVDLGADTAVFEISF